MLGPVALFWSQNHVSFEQVRIINAFILYKMRVAIVWENNRHISRRQNWFPHCEISSEERAEKFHNIDVSGKCFWLVLCFVSINHQKPNCVLVSLAGRAPVCWAGGRGFESRPDQHSGFLKKLRRKSCVCNDICEWLAFLVFSVKDEKS